MAFALLVPSTVVAQTTEANARTAQKNDISSTAASDNKQDDDVIIVTGSLIGRGTDPVKSISPVQVLTSEATESRGLLSVTEALQSSSLIGSNQTYETASTGYSTGNGGFGSSSIGLRGLGAVRTLTLLNGRRVGSSGIGASVSGISLNSLPMAIVDRTDILTNGASSIYGSDAVAGVVNIITKKEFSGIALNANVSIPEGAGGRYYMLSGRFGKKWDTGHVSLGVSFNKQTPLRADQRDWSACDQDYVFDAVTGERADVPGLDGKPKCWGTGYLYKYASTGAGSTVGGAAGYLALSPDAKVSTGNNADFNGYRRVNLAGQNLMDRFNGMSDSFSGGLNGASGDMITRSQLISVFATASKELSDNFEVYGEALWTRRESRQNYLYWFNPNSAGVMSADHPHNPFNYANNKNWVDQAGNPLQSARSTLYFSFLQQPEQKVDFLNTVIGMRGNLFNDWKWDLYANYSRSEAVSSQLFAYHDRVVATLAANGCDKAVLKSATDCPAGSIDWWRAYKEGFSEEEYNFLIGRDHGTTVYEQNYIEGIARGSLFDLPGGTASGALGFHMRREAIDSRPGQNADNRSPVMPFDPISNTTSGSMHVKEAFAELSLPILEGVKGA